MSGTIARKVAAGVACALALGGCGSDDDDAGPDAGGASGGGASGFTSDGVTFSGGGGDQVTFSSGADQVTFAGGADQVTFSSGNPSGVTFSSPGAATFSSPPAPAAPVAPVVPGPPVTPSTDASGTPVGGSSINPADVGAADELGGDEPAGIDAPSSSDGPSGTPTRGEDGEDPRFGFWDAEDITEPDAPDAPDGVLRIALHDEEIWLERFIDEAGPGGSGQNCWSPDPRDPVRLVPDGDDLVEAEPSEGSLPVEYSVDSGGSLHVYTYAGERLRSEAIHGTALWGLAFADFPVCGDT